MANPFLPLKARLSKDTLVICGVIRSIGHKRRKYFLSGLSKCKPFVVPTYNQTMDKMCTNRDLFLTL